MNFFEHLQDQLKEIKAKGLYKDERVLDSPQGTSIRITKGGEVLNFCSNNYLGLANDPHLIQAAKEGLENYGFGLASVRFICGTQTLHKELEKRLSSFLGTEDTILYSSCFDANGGLFEAILGPEDAVISDALNHASMIDGIRLCKAKRLIYAHGDMEELAKKLQETQSSRFRLIATDGVFSMEGTVANLQEICDLAAHYHALVMVDDCHAAGFLGNKGRGTPEFCGVEGKIDILTGTLGKALGGAAGGYTSGRKELVEWLRQRSRPYLFSNALTPSIAAAGLKILSLLESSDDLRKRLQENTRYFRERMTGLGFTLVPGSHPIVPIMLSDAKLAHKFAAKMLDRGIYVIGFSYPVVPEGKARIRVQLSAAHTKEDIDKAVYAFEEVRKDTVL